MAVRIDVKISGNITGLDEYQVTLEVVGSENIPEHIFLHARKLDRFERVITPRHLKYPEEPEESASYYRSKTASTTFDTLSKAFRAKKVYTEAIKELVRAYEKGLENFIQEETLTIEAD